MCEAETKSEELFEKLCQMNDWQYEKLVPDGQRTPDYRLVVADNIYIVEVKEIEHNKADRAAEANLRNGEAAIVSSKPGQRIRSKIASAGPQISRLAKGKHPSILVLYNKVTAADYTSPYNIRAGMYGFEQLKLSVPKAIDSLVRLIGRGFGRGWKFGTYSNTSISSIGVLVQNCEDLRLKIYHNSYAAIPIDSNRLNAENIEHYKLEEYEKGKIQDWVAIAT